MTEFITNVFAWFIGSGVALAVAAYLGQSFISQLLSRNVESHKNELAKQLAEFNSKLSSGSFEHQARFTALHERRANVVVELYQKVTAALKAITEMSSLMQHSGVDKEKQQKDAADAYNALQEFFNLNRLFLGNSAAEKCSKLLDMQRSAYFEFQGSQGFGPGGQVDHKWWISVWEKVSKEIPVVLRELEAEFHKILGITD